MAGAERGPRGQRGQPRGQPRGQRGQPRGQRGPPGAGLRLLLLLGGLAALAAAQVTSEDQEVPEHKPVELRCAAFRSSSGSARIEWKFQRGSSLALIYYEGELTEPYRDRVQFSPTSIRFQSVTREDSGKYICEVVGDGSQIAKSEVNLIVQVPPGKPLAHVPSSATVGARAVLSLSLWSLWAVCHCPCPCGHSGQCVTVTVPVVTLGSVSLSLSLSLWSLRAVCHCHCPSGHSGQCVTVPVTVPVPAVPPGKPLAHVPSSATVGARAVLSLSL
ncbi:junctional adhesion molecule A isoform X1 [Haemorhous mexicanus]|uniref:junctional adhesion molecule A isoform X1 n=1 Tax=Haemorhous mexicanus TaxID=30427 RepID=UPI0028BED59C|nr:junctional adhesion molecule A isoform X1 [Haemorhous mexicanus]